MAKQNSENNEYMGQFGDGTYQTGAIRQPKHGNGLLAFLLALVIVLAALCSALGILNVRLLGALSQAQQETTPLSMNSQPQTTDSRSFLEQLELPVPQVPDSQQLQLQIAESPSYTADPRQEGVLSSQQILECNHASLVTVQCLTQLGNVQSGMGLVLSSDGYLLTNHHVVDGARRIFVKLPDGTLHRAALVGSDSFPDLAVLYVDAQGLQPAVFSSNRQLQAEDPSFSVSFGDEKRELLRSAVSTVSNTFTSKSSSLELIQTRTGRDAGPVFDSFGHVMGFQVSRICQYFTDQDIGRTGLVLPTDMICQIVNSLVSQGRVDGRPSLGIEVEAISKVYQQYWHLPVGLLVTQVAEDSQAAIMGLQEGDILMTLDGVDMDSCSDLYTALYNHHIGDQVIAVICRDEETFTLELTVEEN